MNIEKVDMGTQYVDHEEISTQSSIKLEPVLNSEMEVKLGILSNRLLHGSYCTVRNPLFCPGGKPALAGFSSRRSREVENRIEKVLKPARPGFQKSKPSRAGFQTFFYFFIFYYTIIKITKSYIVGHI